jgi:hypothetical protein
MEKQISEAFQFNNDKESNAENLKLKRWNSFSITNIKVLSNL